eukprot:jgi/Hompol1/47/HPOL_002427-RA
MNKFYYNVRSASQSVRYVRLDPAELLQPDADNAMDSDSDSNGDGDHESSRIIIENINTNKKNDPTNDSDGDGDGDGDSNSAASSGSSSKQLRWMHIDAESWKEYSAFQHAARRNHTANLADILASPQSSPLAYLMAAPLGVYFVHPPAPVRLPKHAALLDISVVLALLDRLEAIKAMSDYASIVGSNNLHSHIDLDRMFPVLLDDGDVSNLITFLGSSTETRFKLYQFVENKCRMALVENMLSHSLARNYSKAVVKIMSKFPNDDVSAFVAIHVSRKSASLSWTVRDVMSLAEPLVDSANNGWDQNAQDLTAEDQLEREDFIDSLVDRIEYALNFDKLNEKTAGNATDRASSSSNSYPEIDAEALLLENALFQVNKSPAASLILPHLARRFPVASANNPQLFRPSGYTFARKNSVIVRRGAKGSSLLLPLYTSKTPIIFVDTTAKLEALHEHIAQIQMIGIDAEWHDESSDNVCIFQIAALDSRGSRTNYIVDMIGLAPSDLLPVFTTLFTKPDLIMLGCSPKQDISKLKSILDPLPDPVELVDVSTLSFRAFEAQFAANGIKPQTQYSLATMVTCVLGKTLDKRMQM